MYIDIIIFAIVAIAIGLKLYNTLGIKTDSTHDIATALGAEINKHQNQNKEKEEVISESEKVALDSLPESMKLEIEKVKKYSPNFLVSDFLNKVEAVFEIIVEAFAKADEKTLKTLCSKEVFEQFKQQIKLLKDKGRHLHIDVIAVPKNIIKKIKLTGSKADITLDITSEQIIMMKDKSGKLISGDSKRIEEINDEWVFSRDLKSKDPVWVLVKT